jgi:predicted methyltransferase
MARLPDPPAWRTVPVLSGRMARRILDAAPGAVDVSLDLGRSTCAVQARPESVLLPDGQSVATADLADSFSDPSDCIAVEQGSCHKVYLYSKVRRRYYKLWQPFENRAPTVIINNATMHAIVRKDPWQDEADKVAALPPRGGECLDTCCGLGYSAQMLAEAGFTRVATCEVDANVLGVAALNPWSEGLFCNPRITIFQADVRGFVAGCAAGRFSCVFHDPPTVFQAGELYSEDLYRELARVLSRGGALYHYVGAPGARVGRDYGRGVMRRLQAVGFVEVRRVTGGVLAARPR